jgi:undecaprenyl-diphosphatase
VTRHLHSIEQSATVLADHAVLLLAAGIAAAVLFVLAVLGAVRLAARVGPRLLRIFRDGVGMLPRGNALLGLFARSRTLLPGLYVTTHVALGLLAVAAAAVFLVLAEEAVAGGPVAAFDEAFAEALQDRRTPRLDRAFAAISALGAGRVLTLLTAIGVVIMIRQGDRPVALVWGLSQAGGGLLNYLLKETFERARPAFADAAFGVTGWSFPSGHAMGTFVFCGVAGYLLARATRSWSVAAATVAVAAAWSMAMAFSRLYLGVHYASDVVAGLVAGAAWVAVCVSAMEVIRRRRRGVPAR